MECPKCKKGKMALVDYQPVFIIENAEHAKKHENMLLDNVFACEVHCFSCGFTKNIEADITYPEKITT